MKLKGNANADEGISDRFYDLNLKEIIFFAFYRICYLSLNVMGFHSKILSG